MVSKFIVTFVIIYALGVGAKKLPMPPQHPYIMHVNLAFNEQNITHFVAESFFASNGLTAEPTTAQCNISLFDVIHAIPFKKMTEAELSTAFGSLGIVLEDDDIQEFMENMDYTELSNMGFSTSRMFKTFVKTYFTNGTSQLLSVLEAFNVGEEFTVAYAFGTDEEMFNALKEAEFSLDAITEVEALLNTTFTLKDVSNILGIKKFDSQYLQNFINTHVINFLITKELQQVNFEAFLNALKFTLHEYKDMKSFKTCYKALTQSNSLAVAVSPNEILTNDDTVLQNHLRLSGYTTLNIVSVQDKKSSFTVTSHSTQGNGLTRFTVAEPIASYIEEATSYEDVATKACTYVTDGIKNLISQPAMVQMSGTQLKVAKLPGTTFKKSSPVICETKLFGLADSEDIYSISFAVFGVVEQSTEIIAPIEQTDLSQNPEVLAMVNQMFQNFLLTFNPCNYMNCTSTPAPEVAQEELKEPEITEVLPDEVIDEQVQPENHVSMVDNNAGNVKLPESEVQEPSPIQVVEPQEVLPVVVVEEPVVPVAEREPEEPEIAVEQQADVQAVVQELTGQEIVPEAVAPESLVEEAVAVEEPTLSKGQEGVITVQEPVLQEGENIAPEVPKAQQPAENQVAEGQQTDMQAVQESVPESVASETVVNEAVADLALPDVQEQTVAEVAQEPVAEEVQEPSLPVAEVQTPGQAQVAVEEQTLVDAEPTIQESVVEEAVPAVVEVVEEVQGPAMQEAVVSDVKEVVQEVDNLAPVEPVVAEEVGKEGSVVEEIAQGIVQEAESLVPEKQAAVAEEAAKEGALIEDVPQEVVQLAETLAPVEHVAVVEEVAKEGSVLEEIVPQEVGIGVDVGALQVEAVASLVDPQA